MVSVSFKFVDFSYNHSEFPIHLGDASPIKEKNEYQVSENYESISTSSHNTAGKSHC